MGYVINAKDSLVLIPHFNMETVLGRKRRQPKDEPHFKEGLSIYK